MYWEAFLKNMTMTTMLLLLLLLMMMMIMVVVMMIVCVRAYARKWRLHRLVPEQSAAAVSSLEGAARRKQKTSHAESALAPCAEASKLCRATQRPVYSPLLLRWSTASHADHTGSVLWRDPAQQLYCNCNKEGSV